MVRISASSSSINPILSDERKVNIIHHMNAIAAIAPIGLNDIPSNVKIRTGSIYHNPRIV